MDRAALWTLKHSDENIPDGENTNLVHCPCIFGEKPRPARMTDALR